MTIQYTTPAGRRRMARAPANQRRLEDRARRTVEAIPTAKLDEALRWYDERRAAATTVEHRTIFARYARFTRERIERLTDANRRAP